MNQPPNILIVTPTLGDRESLAQTVESVGMMGGGIRHVIVCPVRSMNKLRERFGHQCEVIGESGKAGVYSAVNDILLHPDNRCEWVGYINDDDYWLSGMHRMIKRAATSNADILYGRIEFVDINGAHLAYSSSTVFYKLFPPLAAHGAYLLSQQAVLIRRRLFERLGGFDTKYRIQADNDFWIRAIRSGAKCEYVNRICGAYRMHDQQLSADQYGLKERAQMLAYHGISRSSVSARLAFLLYRMFNLGTYAMRIARGSRSIRAEAGRPPVRYLE